MPTHTHSITHGLMPGSRYSRRAVLSGTRYPKHLGVHAGAVVWAGTVGGRDVDCGLRVPRPHDPTGLR